MPSPAAQQFAKARSSAHALIDVARGRQVTSAVSVKKSTCLHAALAALVAAWEAYLERLVRDAQIKVTDPANAKLSATAALLSTLTEKELRRFNTPNADNSRTLLISYTGYDPINDWVWPTGRLGGIQTRQRIDEVLQIRHSFAHGYSIPTNIAWARNRNSPGALNITTVKQVDVLFAHLVRSTDRGMAQHLSAVFGVPKPW